jgi:hypothetical protein
MTHRASIFGPAATTPQAISGAVVAFALSLLVGFELGQDDDSTVFAALLVGLAVLMIGLKRRRPASRRTRRSMTDVLPFEAHPLGLPSAAERRKARVGCSGSGVHMGPPLARRVPAWR